MEVRSTQTENRMTVSLIGELDHHAARETMQRLEHLLDAGMPMRLKLDLSRVTFMDSSGIAVVLRAHRRMAEQGGTLTLGSVPAQAKKVLRAAGLDRTVAMEESL